ncbi:retinoid-binding protein 7-like [Misgurnus anguillicaudatus]|uniref:retinoid-binding protein 7-like n=1 Tax=Misgurnus anguillicaudatus TaxID=75329 RepID=UPI003CCF443B
MPASMCGTWDMHSNVNFEEYMIALGIGLYTRKVALKLKQRKVIEQVGDQYVIKTLSTFRNYVFSFRVNEEFQEFTKGLDNRHCKQTTAARVPLVAMLPNKGERRVPSTVTLKKD